ncbi:hypothetical protein BDN70DRAFT_936015 [Pholiota conissans]|uniref:Uncharacterized protein n=1 Tax=Pholiota conissans TaxID=109636 RepID=A0A9P5YUB7_9AGAR|nr:hypothetical protein BDN70DRAFT_936015 [Pholiota conissans]
MGEFSPQEPADVLFAEKAWLQGALLAAVAYGIEFTLFVMCFYLLLRQHQLSSQESNTLFYASNAQFTQLAFVDNRNIPGGPNTYEEVMFSIPIDELGNVCAIMTTWLADALIVWRCQVIFSSSRFPIWAIMLFPYLLWLGSFVMGVLFLIQVSAASPWTTSTINWTIPFFSLSLSLNIILTTVIVVRLMLHRRQIGGIMEDSHGKHYTSIAAMVIESASIFSVFSLLFLVPFVLNNAINQIFFQALSIVQINAMLLIIFRVAQGKGWTRNTAMQITTDRHAVSGVMQFAPGPDSTTALGSAVSSDTKGRSLGSSNPRLGLEEDVEKAIVTLE